MSLSSRLSTRPTDTRTETSNQSASRRQSLASRHCAAPTGPNRHPHTHHSRSTNGTARHARHVTTRPKTFSAVCLFRPLHPPVVREPAGANHRRLLPTKKSAAPLLFFFPSGLGNSEFYFRSARPLNRALPGCSCAQSQTVSDQGYASKAPGSRVLWGLWPWPWGAREVEV